VKYVSSLTEGQKKKLKEIMKKDLSSRVRMRAHCILLSGLGFTINDIAKIYHVDRDSVSSWIDSWEQFGFNGLYDKPRSGRPRILKEEEQEIAIELIKKYPRSIKTVIEKLAQITGKIVSISTLKRLAKKAGLIWKRIKKSLKSKRDDKEFEKAKQEIQELKQQQQTGEIDLYYFDESGFSLETSIPYAWQPIGQNIEIPNSRSSRLNVLGFLNTNNQFQSFMFEDSINSGVVIACFDYFCEIITKKTVVVIDNAPTHTSQQFNENIKKWEEKGLFIKNIPSYCPELNLIEILWRFIKYLWLPFSAVPQYG